MYTTTLNRTFICRTCNVVILFESDMEEHKRILGHSRFQVYDLRRLENEIMGEGDRE